MIAKTTGPHRGIEALDENGNPFPASQMPRNHLGLLPQDVPAYIVDYGDYLEIQRKRFEPEFRFGKAMDNLRHRISAPCPIDPMSKDMISPDHPARQRFTVLDLSR